MRIRQLLIYVGAVIMIGVYAHQIVQKIGQISRPPVAGESGGCFFSDEPNLLETGPQAAAAQEIQIELNDPVELDFQTAAQIMALRKECAQRYPGLLVWEYVPWRTVFGQIVDRRPWWGLDGEFCHGQGKKSIKGASEESRFLVNPYLLLGLDEGKSFGLPWWMGPCDPAYPRPVSLEWYPGEGQARVTYDMTRFFRERKRIPVDPYTLQLIGYNARDFGFEYIHADLGRSENVKSSPGSKLFDAVISLKSFIHLGGSCGYPGGCNNQSPREPDLFFTVSALPARLYCTLWKDRPAEKEAPPDFVFIIHMK